MPKLTALGAKRLVEPGRYGDGEGLWLQVRDAEHRSWTFRWKRDGKLREMGLGAFPDVSLAEARDAAAACRRQLRDGVDPIEQRRSVRAAAKAAEPSRTFEDVAKRYIDSHRAGWRSEIHAAQWGASLKRYAYPVFGPEPVSAVTTAGVLKALEPIWRTKPETASRLRGRVHAVLDYAKSQGWRDGENPARWAGHLSNLLPSRRSVGPVQHFKALPYVDMAAFMEDLRSRTGTAAIALQFVILTACRTNEALGARWREIDLAAAIWTVPAERMKAGREHRVPLSDATLAVLAEMQPLAAGLDSPVFSATSAGKQLSNMALLALLRRMERLDLTSHGFRSTFRDWAAEVTSYPREVAEMALAHTLRDRVEAAYRRGDLFDKRRAMMADWATFCGLPPVPGLS